MHFVSSQTRSHILQAAAGSMGTGGISDAAARSSGGIGSIIADRWDPRDHFVQIARIDTERFDVTLWNIHSPVNESSFSISVKGIYSQGVDRFEGCFHVSTVLLIC